MLEGPTEEKHLWSKELALAKMKDAMELRFPWRMHLVLEENGALLSAMLLPSKC